jgi:hypothetical protein
MWMDPNMRNLMYLLYLHVKIMPTKCAWKITKLHCYQRLLQSEPGGSGMGLPTRLDPRHSSHCRLERSLQRIAMKRWISSLGLSRNKNLA